MPPFLVECIVDFKKCDDRFGNLILYRLVIFLDRFDVVTGKKAVEQIFDLLVRVVAIY